MACSTDASSQLVRSFWAGKLIQSLQSSPPLPNQGEEMPLSAPQGASNSPQSQTPPGAALEEALGCVAKHETSLSPRVYTVLHAMGTGGGRGGVLGGTLILHREDGTLDWSAVARYLDEGEMKGWGD